MAPDAIRGWFEDQNYVEGGIFLLKHEGTSVGTLWVVQAYNDPRRLKSPPLGSRRTSAGRAWPAAAAPRHGVRSAARVPVGRPVVNAENESAVRLYQSEGFVVTETIVCYALDCHDPG